MNILIISPDYPNIYRAECPFVKQLVDEFARQGHNCCVIAPYNKMHNRKDYSYEEVQAIGTKQVLVYRPKYFTVSNVKVLGRHISSILFERAVKRTLRRISFVPDAVYGHFWFSAVAGYEYARRRKIPLIAATGESDIKMMNPDLNHSKSICQKVDGVVCVSSKNMESGTFVEEVKAALEKAKFPPKNLEIEVTEYCLLQSFDKTIENIKALREMGVQVALDDFGTGYSSLSYLEKLPINLLKIDKSLVDDIEKNFKSQQFVSAVIYMGHLMGCEVVCEGVESEGQLRLLKNNKSDFIQGYIWGKPMDFEKAKELISA